MRAANRHGPLCRFELVASDARGNTMQTLQPAFPPRGTRDRFDALISARYFVRDMKRAGYTITRRRARG